MFCSMNDQNLWHYLNGFWLLLYLFHFIYTSPSHRFIQKQNGLGETVQPFPVFWLMFCELNTEHSHLLRVTLQEAFCQTLLQIWPISNMNMDWSIQHLVLLRSQFVLFHQKMLKIMPKIESLYFCFYFIRVSLHGEAIWIQIMLFFMVFCNDFIFKTEFFWLCLHQS